MYNRIKKVEAGNLPVLHKANVSRRCWIVATDADTGNIRPAYVTKKDAKELQVTGYADYQSCLAECKVQAEKWGRICA